MTRAKTTDNISDVSPFLTLELKTRYEIKKPNDISSHKNGLEPINHSATGKGGSAPFLGTIRLFTSVLRCLKTP